MSEKDTRTSSLLNAIKNHKWLSIVIVFGAIVIGASSFLNSALKLVEDTEKIGTRIFENGELVAVRYADGIVYQTIPQASPTWGWAASIQAAVRHHGLQISQVEIMQRVGDVFHESAFSGEYLDSTGKSFEIWFESVPFPTDRELLEFSELGKPVLIKAEGAVLLLIEATFEMQGPEVSIETLRLYNPQPGSVNPMIVVPEELLAMGARELIIVTVESEP